MRIWIHLTPKTVMTPVNVRFHKKVSSLIGCISVLRTILLHVQQLVKRVCTS
jgi:hypothetical protein